MSNVSRPAGAGSAEPRVVYSERLWIPPWWWIIGAGVCVLVGYELHLAFRGVPAWIFMVALQPISLACGMWLSRSKITVAQSAAPAGSSAPSERASAGRPRPDGMLHIAGRAHLPLSAIARTVAVPRSAKRAAMGPQLDPAAFVHQRPWIGPLALIVLDDPDDPTPYWLIGTRHPQRLLSALGAPSDSIPAPAARHATGDGVDDGAGGGEGGSRDDRSDDDHPAGGHTTAGGEANAAASPERHGRTSSGRMDTATHTPGRPPA